MLILYLITAIVGTIATSALAGLLGAQGALSLLAWGILGANMAAVTVAMLRLLLLASLDSPAGFLHTSER
jgi:hypothetical protein